jgi:hypothetical protein
LSNFADIPSQASESCDYELIIFFISFAAEGKRFILGKVPWIVLVMYCIASSSVGHFVSFFNFSITLRKYVLNEFAFTFNALYKIIIYFINGLSSTVECLPVLSSAIFQILFTLSSDSDTCLL